MGYTRQSLMRMATEMDKDWNIFDLLYYWQENGNEDMYKLFWKMSKRDCLWVMNQCFQELGENQYNDKVLIKMHRNVYAVLADRV